MTVDIILARHVLNESEFSIDGSFIFLFPSLSVVFSFRMDKRVSERAPDLCKQH